MENGQERYIIKIETQGGEEVVQIYDQIQKKGVEAGKALDESAKKVAKAEIDKSKEIVNANKKSLDDVRREWDKLEKEISAKQKVVDRASMPGATRGDKAIASQKQREIDELRKKQEALDAEAQKYADEMERASNIAEQLEAKVAQASTKQESMRTEMRNTREEAAQLLNVYRNMTDEERESAEGKAMLKKINELTEKAGHLKDAMDDINRATRANASDTHTFDAISEGLDSVISLYGIGQGAAAAFGASEQELMEMQTKLQAVLAASNALKTLQNNLQKESNMMVAVGNIQLAAKAKAEALATGGTWAHVAAQKAFNLVASMNPYVLLATALATLVGGVYIFTKATNASKDAQAKQAAETKRQAEEYKKLTEAQKHEAEVMGNHAADLMLKYKDLQNQFKKLRTEAEKKKWVDDNKSAFEALGLSVNSLNDAYDVLVKNAPKVINALKEMAKAEAIKELYQEAYKKQMIAESDNVRRYKVRTWREKQDARKDDIDASYGQGTYDRLKAEGGTYLAFSQQKLNAKGVGILSALEKQKQYGIADQARTDKINGLKDDVDKFEKMLEDAQDSALKAQAGVSQFGTSSSSSKTDKQKKEIDKEMAQTVNEYSRAWYEMVINKLKEELQNTPKVFDGADNPEYERVKNELELAISQFEDAFGDNMLEMIKQLEEDFASPGQRRARIKADYASKRSIMINAGFGSENIEELNKQESDALDALDLEIAQRERTFSVWMESLTGLTIKGLENALKQAEEELKKAEGIGDDKKTMVARAKVTQAREKLEKKKVSTSPEKGSIEKWNELYKVLVDCSKEFDEIGEVVGGVAGDIIKAAGQIATSTVSMINGIQKLATSSIDATEAAAVGASNAIKAAESASVILTIISAALQIVTAIYKMLDKSSSQKSYENAQKVYEGTVKALDWAIDKQREYASVLAGSDAIDAYDKAIDMTRQLQKSARELGTQYLQAGASLSSRSNGVYERRNISEKAWQEGADALGVSVSTFQSMMGGRLSGLFKLSVDQLEKLKTDASSFYGSLNDETQKYWDSILENEEKVKDIMEEQIEQLSTLSKGGLADEWKSLLEDMSTTGKDFADSFNETLTSAIVNSVVNAKFGDRLEQIRKKMADGLADGTLTSTEANALRDEYNQLATIAMQTAREALEEAGIDTMIDQSFSKEAAASVTQETMDEVNGRLTAVQVDLQMISSIAQISQTNLANIEKYTSYIPSMAYDIAQMRDDISQKL